jgi:polyglutamine-binding protein 1
MRRRLAVEQSSNLGYKNCPNKYNIFHKCSLFCIQNWGEGISKPDAAYKRRHQRLLEKYPLPKGWKEVYDVGM